jgi:KDO2-lipid IV(A) lauroyltransferase
LSDFKRRPAGLRKTIEFAAVRVVVGVVGMMPRTLARAMGAVLGWVAFYGLGKLRRTGLRNLALAFSEKSETERLRILGRMYRNMGWQMAEFCKMPGYSAAQASEFIRYDGLENYLRARERGKGVLVLTGHLGAWELSSFYHSLRGYPMSLVIRRLDNERVDGFVNRIRCLHGNRVIHKDDFARGLLKAMNAGETVGILMDTNMTPPQGVFVPFFGVEACTATAMARIALKTGAAVLPGFLLWEQQEGKYVLRFGEELELVRSDDLQGDIVENTARFTATIESYVRRYPEQWLWVHRRWKTRPPGAERMYP